MGKLIYGTMTGTTVGVAQSIQASLSDFIDEIKCVDKARADDLRACDFLVLGGSTWGDGELTDDWADFLPQLESVDFRGKTVALFALGDQAGYTYNFVSAMKTLYDKVKVRGADIIACDISPVGYDFSHSEAVVDGNFIGLPVDEVNEPELTQARIRAWAEKVRQSLLARVE
jgi:flavodoxin I